MEKLDFFIHANRQLYRLKSDTDGFYPCQDDIYVIKGLGVFKVYGNLFMPHHPPGSIEPQKAIIRVKKLMHYHRKKEGSGYYGVHRKRRNQRKRPRVPR